MKKTLILIISILFSQIVFSQSIDLKSIEAKVIDQMVETNGYPGSQHPMMIEKEKKIADYLRENPSEKNNSLKKPMDWGFSVGDTHSWWADYFIESLDGSEQYEVPSTCRAVGTHCYVFVEDAVWNNYVDQNAANAVRDEFDNTIYPTDVATFGTPPDKDSDPKIIILMLDIQDGNDPSSYVAGYFYGLNQRDDTPGVDGSRSNEAEIFYMDCYPADPINDPIGVFGTTAHEFQHMIHYAHGYPEMTFINEALSEIAQYVCGYGLRGNGLYTANTNVNLIDWDGTGNVLEDYSRAAFWMLYLYEQYQNTSLLMDFVNNQHSTVWDIDSTLRGVNASLGFYSVLLNWWIANYTNGSSSVSEYNYTYSPLSKPTPVATHIGNNGTGSGSLEPLAAEYITFSGGDDLSITFTGDNVVKIKALKIGSLEIQDINKDTEYSFPGYGTTYSEITFLVYNDSPGATQNYSYIGSGAGLAPGSDELFYEDGEPDGYAPAGTWANPGDSVAVKFDGFPDAILDSVKFAFRRSGTIQMDISKYDGGTNLRGNILHGPVNVISNDSTDVPYPVPYENWVTVDLSGHNIDASDDFVVSLLLGANTSEPGIMVSAETISGHSYWYDSTQNSWITYTTDGGSKYWNYFIRAYIHWGNLAIELDPSGIVTIPNDFSLEANYPNPFNPSTTFDFATPNDGVVNFTVYDLLGQVIYTENRTLFAGNYQFIWDGQNQLDQQVVSGVYFLQMEADGFTQTRKMLMMK